MTLVSSGKVTSLKSAVPDEKSTLRVTGRTVRRFRLTLKSIVSSVPSIALASLIEADRGTALTMVPTPTASLRVAPVTFDSLTSNVSSLSATASSMIGMETVFCVSPGWNVKVPSKSK